MKYLSTYQLFESNSGPSVLEIGDILLDLTDKNFYHEVNEDVDNETERTLEDNETMDLDKNYNIVIMRNELMSGDDLSDEEFENTEFEFSWEEAVDSITMLIKYLSSFYNVSRVQANIDENFYNLNLDSYKDGEIIGIYPLSEGGEEKFSTSEDIISNICIILKPKK